jgi:homogentisate 1,2-dioxygenase
VYGVYDAKPVGFTPGGFSLHNMMLPHGPDAPAFEHASNEPMVPKKLTGTMAFMFETRLPQRITAFAASLKTIDSEYLDCWTGLKRRFNPAKAQPDW